MEKALVLRNLTIRHKEYYSHVLDASKPMQYEGALEFVGETGEIKIRLNGDLSQKILAVVSEAMVVATRELAENLTADVLAGTPLLISANG